MDASNGPGTNFLDLPPAIAAAASGDTILVRPGLYTCLVASQPVTVTLDGLIPFAQFAGIVDLSPSFLTAYSPVLLGELLVAPPGAGFVQGSIGAFGAVQIPLTMGVSASLSGVPIYAQFGVLDPSVNQIRLSNGSVRLFN